VVHPRGICSGCRESALACRACRAINYDGAPRAARVTPPNATQRPSPSSAPSAAGKSPRDVFVITLTLSRSCRHARFDWALLVEAEEGRALPAAPPVSTAAEAAAAAARLAPAGELGAALARAQRAAAAAPGEARAAAELARASAAFALERSALKAFLEDDGGARLPPPPRRRGLAPLLAAQAGAMRLLAEAEEGGASEEGEAARERLAAALLAGEGGWAPLWPRGAAAGAAGAAEAAAAAEALLSALLSRRPRRCAAAGAALAARARALAAAAPDAQPDAQPFAASARVLERLAAAEAARADAPGADPGHSRAWEEMGRAALAALLPLARAGLHARGAAEAECMLPLLRLVAAPLLAAARLGGKAAAARRAPPARAADWLPDLALRGCGSELREQAAALLRALLASPGGPPPLASAAALLPAAAACAAPQALRLLAAALAEAPAAELAAAAEGPLLPRLLAALRRAAASGGAAAALGEMAALVLAAPEARARLLKLAPAALEALAGGAAALRAPLLAASGEGGEAARVALASALAAALASPRAPPAAAQLLSLLCELAAPFPAAGAGAQLQLLKAASQEEFIRGSCGRAPVPASALPGPLMRHVKDWVCARLGLDGLVGDEYGMELLVGGRLVALDAPVQLLHDRVWAPAQAAAGGGARPMAVTYRLAGLDGEASEERLSLDSPELAGGGGGGGGDADFRPALLAAAWPALLAQAAALGLGRAGRLPERPPDLSLLGDAAARETGCSALLRLLDAASRDADGCARLRAAGALAPLEAAAAAAAGGPAFEPLLRVLERLLAAGGASAAEAEAAGAAAAAPAPPGDARAEAARAQAFWAQLGAACAPGGAAGSRAALARVLARLAAAQPAAAAALAAEVAPALAAAGAALAASAPPPPALLAAAELLDVAAAPMRARLAAPAAAEALHRLLAAAAAAGAGLRGAALSSAVLRAAPGLPLALRLLAGLAGGGEAAAARLAGWAEDGPGSEPAPLRALQALEGCAEGGVGGCAEEALEALSGAGCGRTKDAVQRLRAASREAARARALATREAMLAQMGMTRLSAAAASPGASPGCPSPSSFGAGDRIVASSPAAAAGSAGSAGRFAVGGESCSDDSEAEEWERSDALRGAGPCAVCQEGARRRPTELMGVYVFAKRVPAAPLAQQLAAATAPAEERPAATLAQLLGAAEAAPAAPAAVATVSHFNPIHISCHVAARRADAALRAPKAEWAGAEARAGAAANPLLTRF